MKTVILGILIALLLWSPIASAEKPAEITEAEARFLEHQPSAVKVADGVYAVENGSGSLRTYGFGLGGMKYDLETMKAVLETAEKSKESESYQGLIESIALLEDQIARSSSDSPKASQSGTACGAIRYDLTASVFNSFIWYLDARAESGFLQWGAGPPLPFDVVVTTFAQTISTLGGNTIIDTDSDTKTYPPNGLQYLSADPAAAGAGPSSQCMEGIAQATISVQACGAAGYKSLTETDSVFC